MERLRDLAAKTGILLSDEQIGQFRVYYEMLVEKNKVMNLTAITELEDVIVKHFMDSVAVAGVYPEIAERKLSVIDVGPGAGFPGIPLKIAFPQLDVTLLDSLNKRVNYLNEQIVSIGLDNSDGSCTAIHSRAEDGARNKELRDAFDIAVSRAVAALPVLLEYCLPFVKPGGVFIAYKSGEVDEELKTAANAIKKLNGKLKEVKKITLSGSDNEAIERSFVIIEKTAPTPKQYPRKAGTASKQPL